MASSSAARVSTARQRHRRCKALPDVPWGAQSNVLAAEDVSALIEAGADFISLTGLTSSLETLRDEDIGKLLVVPVDLKEEHARSLEVMPVDAIVYADAVRDAADPGGADAPRDGPL